ncbi:uncharacterized protein LOC135396603 [Ornithodoros turicata]
MSADCLTLLCSATKADRDQGLQELQKYLHKAQSNEIKHLEECLFKILEEKPSSWRFKLGGLLGIKSLISHMKDAQYEGRAGFRDKTVAICLDFLTDSEVRVRLEAGQVLGLLCAFDGVQIYAKCHPRLVNLITSNLSCENQHDISIDESRELQNEGRSAAKVLNDTAPWRFLETSLKCLQAIAGGCSSRFSPYIDKPFIDLLMPVLVHINRFVREAGFCLLSTVIGCCSGPETVFSVQQLGPQVAKGLASGLADNWSQVRLAASEATRKFLLAFPTEEERQAFFPVLIPQMCLNRYYTADGVRIYSQETWRRIAKTEGRELVQRYIDPVVEYYISQTKADNHAVREASCTCIAELASKIKPEVVRPYVTRLLQTLIICFQDEAWPVRDAACLACGSFLLSYPQECRGALESLYPLFFNNLGGCILSVRQGAAVALANVVRAYGAEAYSVLEPKIRGGLAGVQNQGNVHYGHSEWMASTRCGQTDWKYNRPSEPWEVADGCIHLVAELAQIPQMSQEVTQLLPLVAQAVGHKHYLHHVTLLETMCKQLPSIARGINKRNFKQHLEKFLGPIFYGLSCENGLTSSAASQCLNQLSGFLGPSILRARVEQWDSKYLEQLDANIHIAGL